MNTQIGILGTSFDDLGKKINNALDTRKNNTESFLSALRGEFAEEQKKPIEIDVMYPELNNDTFDFQFWLDQLAETDAVVRQGESSWQKYHDELDVGQKWIAKYGQATEGQIRTQEGMIASFKQMREEAIAFNRTLQQQSISARVSTLAIKALAAAGNMLVSTLASMALEQLVTAVIDYINRFENAKEAMEDAKSAFETTQNEIKDLSDEVKTCRDRLEELQKLADNGTISVVEQEELNQLQKTNEELERELRLKQEMRLLDATELAGASTDLMTTTVRSQFTSNGQSVEGQAVVPESVSVEEELNRAIKSYEYYQRNLEGLRQKYTNEEIKGDEYQKARQRFEEGLQTARNRIAEIQMIAEEAKNAYMQVESVGGTLTTDDNKQWAVVNKMTSAYDAFSLSLGNTANAFEELSEQEKRIQIENHLIRVGANEEQAKEIVEQFKDADLDAVATVSLEVEDPETTDFTNAEAFAEKMIKVAQEKADNKAVTLNVEATASSTLSQLEQLSDGFDKFSAIYEDVRNKEDFDFGSLVDEDFSAMFAGSEELKKQYEDFVSVISKSPADINACQSAFDDLVSAWFYGQDPLKNITEETKDLTVAWLEQKGVANAVEIADYALAQAKEKAFVETHNLAEGTAEEIQKLLEEANAAGISESSFYQLVAAMITAENSQLNFTQQISALDALAQQAGITAGALGNLNVAKLKSDPQIIRAAAEKGMDIEDYIASSYSSTIANATKVKIPKVEIPKVNYSAPKPSAKSGSSGSSKSEKEPHVVEVDKYKNLSDAVEAVEAKISRLNETLERTYDTERKIALNNDLINLYKDKQDAITALNKARDEEIKGLVALLREQKFDIEYNPDTDRLLIKNREHINEVSQDVIQTYEEYLSRVDELNNANKESAQQWHELAYSIQDTQEAIHELNLEQYNKQIDDLKQVYDHTDNLKEQIALNQVLIKLYQEQRDELLRINQSRDDEIAKNVQELRSVGIDISYDPNTDTLEIKNREQLNKLTETAQVKYRNMVISSEELADANKKGSERWKELTYAIAETGDEIDELNHKRFEEAIADAEHMIALMANRKDVRGKDLVLYEQMMNDVLKRREDLIADGYQKNKAQIQELERQWIDLYDTRLEREKELLEMQLDDKDGVIGAVTNKIDEQIKGLDEQTKAIDKQIESMQKVNEEHRKALDYQKAQAALDKARNQRTRLVLRKGKGWVYEADQDAVKDVEETVADLKYEAAIDVLEKQKEALEKQKEALEEYKNLWAEIPDEYEKYQNELLAEQELGADWEQKILDGRLDVYTDFKDDYFNLQDDIWKKTDELENHMNEAYLNMVKTFQMMAGLNNLHEQYTDVEQEKQPANKHWYVQQNGKAPAEAQVGDVVYTKGGTYKITAKDENGKFTSEKLNDYSASISDDMWGTEVDRSDFQLVTALGLNTRSTQEMIDSAEREIDAYRNQTFATHGLEMTTQNSIRVTQDQMAAMLKNAGTIDGNSISVEDNTVTIGENTYALEDLTDAFNSFDLAGEISSVMGAFDFGGILGSIIGTTQLPTKENLPENIEAGLKSLSSKLNPFDAYDFSKLKGEDKAHYEQLKEAYNTAISQENAVASSQILSQLAGLIIDSGMTANDMSYEYAKLLVKQDPYSRVDPLTGVSTPFTDDSKSNAYGKAPVAAIKGTTKTIWGLDSTDPDQVNKMVDRGVITREEANKLVQISGSNLKDMRENTDANTYAGDGAYYAGDQMEDAADRIESSNAALGSKIENMSIDVNLPDAVYADKNGYTTYSSGKSGGGGGSKNSGSSNNTSTSSTRTEVVSTSTSKSGNTTWTKTKTTTTDKDGNTKVSYKTTAKSNSGSSGSKSSSSSSGKTQKKVSKPTPTKKKKAKGGTDIPAGLYNVDEKGAEMIIEPSEQPEEGRWHVFKYDGNTVLPADISKNLWEFGLNPPMFMQDKLKNISNQIIYTGSGGSSHTVEHHYHVGNVELSGAKDVLGFMEGLRSLPNDAKQYAARR